MNSTFAQILGKLIKNKMSENLKNFENLKEKKNQNSTLCSTHWPPKSWPNALDHLAIGLVDNEYTKLGKLGEKVLLILGLTHINLPLCYWDSDFSGVLFLVVIKKSSIDIILVKTASIWTEKVVIWFFLTTNWVPVNESRSEREPEKKRTRKSWLETANLIKNYWERRIK